MPGRTTTALVLCAKLQRPLRPDRLQRRLGWRVSGLQRPGPDDRNAIGGRCRYASLSPGRRGSADRWSGRSRTGRLPGRDKRGRAPPGAGAWAFAGTGAP